MFIFFPIVFIFANYIGLSLIKGKDLTKKVHGKSFFISTIICTLGIFIMSSSHDGGVALLLAQMILAAIYNIGFLIGGLFNTSQKTKVIVGINTLILIISIFPFGLFTACIFGDCL